MSPSPRGRPKAAPTAAGAKQRADGDIGPYGGSCFVAPDDSAGANFAGGHTGPPLRRRVQEAAPYKKGVYCNIQAQHKQIAAPAPEIEESGSE